MPRRRNGVKVDEDVAGILVVAQHRDARLIVAQRVRPPPTSAPWLINVTNPGLSHHGSAVLAPRRALEGVNANLKLLTFVNLKLHTFGEIAQKFEGDLRCVFLPRREAAPR